VGTREARRVDGKSSIGIEINVYARSSSQRSCGRARASFMAIEHYLQHIPAFELFKTARTSGRGWCRNGPCLGHGNPQRAQCRKSASGANAQE
jgi:hypothetical protein